MTKMTQTELNTILTAHKKWLDNQDGGKRADLSYADLSYANLSYANLRYANLRSADLRSADLSYADLRSANLRYADLRSADLRSADLRSADLSYANLRYANLTESQGIIWATQGPVGQGRRTLLGYWCPNRGLVITGGCFQGTPTKFRETLARDEPWEWGTATDDQRDAWRKECLKALKHIEKSVTKQLAHLETHSTQEQAA